MLTTSSKIHAKDLKSASGEQLLLMAVFGSAVTKQRIDHELDRRAVAGLVRGRGFSDQNMTTTNGHAA